MAEYIILQAPVLARQVKRLHKNQKQDLFSAINEIAEDPYIGQTKTGDLPDMRVYKFKMAKQLTLLAYKVIGKEIYLMYLGSHENFYRNLKRK